MELASAMSASAAGMDAQSTRLRVIAENLANQDTTGSSPGADAYRRKTIVFANKMDSKTGEDLVQVTRIGVENEPQSLRYDPSNPGSNADGYIKIPNVSSFIEMMDMREAERSYSANLAALEATRTMLERTIDILK